MGEILTTLFSCWIHPIHQESCRIRSLLKIHVIFLISDLSNMHIRSRDVNKGRKRFWGNNFWLKWDTGVKSTSKCLYHRDESIDMQHDLIGSGHYLDLTSNLRNDPFRSHYTSFDAPWREKDDCATISLLYLRDQKLLQKNYFRQDRPFWLSMTSVGQTVDHSSNMMAC